MQRFIQRFSDKIIGVLSGFDRLVLRGSLRSISYTRKKKGFEAFLWLHHILLKDFGPYVERVSKAVKAASCQAAVAQHRPIVYLPSCNIDKEKEAKKVAAQDHITEGLIANITCVEPCKSFKVGPNPETKNLEVSAVERRCLHVYHYLIDPEFGWINARIQTWFPFQIQICFNGRRWLARQMDKAGLQYEQLDNCFPWIENFEKAQELMNEQLRTRWESKLQRFVRMLNPIHDEIFEKFPIRYYWSVYESEWASDLAFKSHAALAAIFPALALHAVTTFSSGDVMRFLGRKVHGCFKGEIVTDFKDRPEGIRVKHRVDKNALKIYDKFGRVLRAECTINNTRDFKVFRRKENDPRGKPKWLRLRKGVADLHRRCQISQAANERYLDALSAADTSTPMGELLHSICKPTTYNGKRIRPLRPWAQDDLELLRTVNRGEFTVNGFRNRDLQSFLFKGTAVSTKEKQRRSARVSRLLRLLRAHHLIKKVPSTYRYVLTAKGSQIIAAVLTAQRITLEQLNRLAA